MSSSDNDKYQLQSLRRAFDLLHCFSPEHAEWGISELASKLQMNKSAVHRVMMTFLKHEFVKQNEDRRYVLGPRVVRLSNVYRSHIDLLTFARPVLQHLAESTGKTCHLAKLHETEVVYLTTVRPRHAVQFTTYPTLCAPVYCTALGKVLLAFLPEEEQNRILRKIKFERRTPNTITGVSRLRRHLQEVRRQGYAVDHEEGLLSLRCVSAPIFNHRGTVEAAVSLSGHVSDINHEILQTYVGKIRAAADAVSSKAGYQPNGQ